MAQDTPGDVKCSFSTLFSLLLLLFLGTIFQRPARSGSLFLEKDWRNRPGRWWGKNRWDPVSPCMAATALSSQGGWDSSWAGLALLEKFREHPFLILFCLQISWETCCCCSRVSWPDLMELKGSSSEERGVPRFPTGETLSCCQSVQEGAAGSHFTAFHLELFQYLYLFLCLLYVFLLIKKKIRGEIKENGIKGNSSCLLLNLKVREWGCKLAITHQNRNDDNM